MPRPLSETIYEAEVGAVVHCDFLHLRKSEVAEVMDSWDRFVYVPIIVDDLSHNMWLHLGRACTANFTAIEPVNWCDAMGPPIAWVMIMVYISIIASLTSRQRPECHA